ncbi:hypothetical protein [Kordia sp.]|uniref:hypothetical protein n=1 Tax=Kordia sp. TaxID=1965332 RepID=UPI003D27F543
MKTIKLITFKLMLLFLTTTLFVNCENDTALETQDEVLTVAKQAPFSSRLVYTNEIERNTIISSKLRGITQNRNNASFESDTNGFTVDTDVANYVEKSDGSGYSYTFAISRDGVVGSELENLVLSVNTDTQELSTVLIKYHYTATQLQELLQTGHVSTHSETTVTPIEGDFSNLLAESNTLPCTIQITTYHITPDTGETFLYGTNSQCQHEIDPDSGETECEVYNVMNILCPPSSSNGTSGTTTSTNNNTNASSDPSNNTSNGGTTTPPNSNNQNDSTDREEIVTTPLLTISQIIGNCMNGNSFTPLLTQEMQSWLRDNRNLSLAISNYIQNVGCNDSSKDFIENAIEAMMEEPSLTFEKYIRERVEEKLEERPFGLIEAPCSELVKWQALAMHNPPVSVTNRVHAIDNQDLTFFTDYAIQTIENAEGHLVNMDYFPVEITSFPINPSTSLPYTPEEFLTYFRLNINSFIDNTWAVFEPVVYQNGSFSIDDTDLWNSNNPMTALLTLDIPVDEGTVIVSDYSDSNFTVITLETPWDSEHPVSGVRDFGFTQNSWGSYVFYTRAVDRMADAIDYVVANSPIPNDVAFFGSDALWNSFQEKLTAFVNLNGGTAQINNKESYRPIWEKIKKVLRGEISIDELDCLE